MRFIHITNWQRFQRFNDRRPSWLRLHTTLHRNEDYLALTGHRRAVLIGIWIEYALNLRKAPDDTFTLRRGLPHDTASLSRRLALRVLTSDLEALNDAGFILFSEHETVTTDDAFGSLDTQILRTRGPKYETTPRDEVKGEGLNVVSLDDFRADLDPTAKTERQVRKSKAELILEAGRGEA